MTNKSREQKEDPAELKEKKAELERIYNQMSKNRYKIEYLK